MIFKAQFKISRTKYRYIWTWTSLLNRFPHPLPFFSFSLSCSLNAHMYQCTLYASVHICIIVQSNIFINMQLSSLLYTIYFIVFMTVCLSYTKIWITPLRNLRVIDKTNISPDKYRSVFTLKIDDSYIDLLMQSRGLINTHVRTPELTHICICVYLKVCVILQYIFESHYGHR